jgi:purine-nucleoside phosphorylase
MATLHLQAEPGDYAPTVLMPGDPLRAEFMARTYLDDVRQVNEIRNMLGFTGTYNGQSVSIQGSGMGVPSIQIYATELIQGFGVERIIRVGSCGALQDGIDLGDLVVGWAAGTDSGVNRKRFGGMDFPAVASWELVRAVVERADAELIPTHVGSIFTGDFFYEPEGSDTFQLLERYGFLAVEMEAAGLYGVAAEYGAQALTVATVSDQIKRSERMSAEDRQSTFHTMITLVLGALFP